MISALSIEQAIFLDKFHLSIDFSIYRIAVFLQQSLISYDPLSSDNERIEELYSEGDILHSFLNWREK